MIVFKELCGKEKNLKTLNGDNSRDDDKSFGSNIFLVIIIPQNRITKNTPAIILSPLLLFLLSVLLLIY